MDLAQEAIRIPSWIITEFGIHYEAVRVYLVVICEVPGENLRTWTAGKAGLQLVPIGSKSKSWSPVLFHVHGAKPQPIQQSRHAGSRILPRLVKNPVVECRLGNLLFGKLANLRLQVRVGGYQ